jgi:hypothetical protein
MIDHFEFESPFGVVGRMVNRLILEKYMRRFLERRNQVLKILAESDDWKQYVTSAWLPETASPIIDPVSCEAMKPHVVVLLISIAGTVAALSAADEKNPAPRQKQDSLPSLDARGVTGIQEIGRPQLEMLMSKSRSLSPQEKAELDRGCPGLVCLYQSLGIKRWPESAAHTVAYLVLAGALQRPCPNGQVNFVFVKQGWWLGGRPPSSLARTGPVSVETVTRVRPGGFTFNYAVYFPDTSTFAWINHREYGFPLNLVQPQKAYLSTSPPPLEETRTAQIFCSTCRWTSPSAGMLPSSRAERCRGVAINALSENSLAL